MKLRVVNGLLNPAEAFKIVAIGYLVGAGAIFGPLFLLFIIISLGVGAPTSLNGEVMSGGASVAIALTPLIMLPFVLAVQAAIFGGLVVFGLWLYRKRRPIVVVDETVQ